MASQHIPQDGLTEADLELKKTVNEMRKCAQSFDPPVSFEKCTTVGSMRGRLWSAIAQSKGTCLTAEKIPSMVTGLKERDSRDRERMQALVLEAEKVMEEVSKYEHINKQLQNLSITSTWRGKAETLRTMLQESSCPIVVAGQVSSGKSSLLNLLVGEDILPTSILHCTGVVCELQYGDERKLELVYPDGRIEEVRYEELVMHVKKDEAMEPEDSDEEFASKVVRISLPVPLLKSGISLVDSPGVGESEAVTQILLDYVSKHDVFGFIFVMKCDDAGGTLQRFREMLRYLADIRDDLGNRKLNPQSVLFVANFWDKVPQRDKERVKEQIITTLSRESCLHGLNPDRQIVYMNSEDALQSFRRGYTTPQFNTLLHNIQDFFPVGHKKKLQAAYNWLERLLLRVLHPLHVLLYSQSRPTGEQVKQLTDHFLTLDAKAGQGMENTLKSAEAQGEELLQKLKDFLARPDTGDTLAKWLYPRPPKQEKELWMYLHRQLPHKYIPYAISSILQSWELETGAFTISENLIVNSANQIFQPIMEQILKVERELRVIGSVDSSNVAPSRLVAPEDDRSPPAESEEAEASPRPAQPTLSTMLFTMQKQADLTKPRDKQRKCKCKKTFKQDSASFIESKAREVLQNVSASEETLKGIIGKEQEAAINYMKARQRQLSETITTNLELLKTMEGEIQSLPSPSTLHGLIRKISDVFGEALEFFNSHARQFEFREQELKESQPLPDMNAMFVPKHQKDSKLVTIVQRKKSGPSNLPLYHFMLQEKLLREHADGSKASIAKFLGMYEVGPALVLDGRLTSARSYWKQCPQQEKQAFIGNFMEQLAKGVQFLHQAQLVHLLLSLDTVPVDERGNPKLYSLFEPAEVARSDGPEDSKVVDYVYIAPEALPAPPSDAAAPGPDTDATPGNIEDTRYTPACDIYALGVTLFELTADVGERSAFRTVQHHTSLENFIADRTHFRQFLFKSSEDSARTQLVKACMADRSARLGLTDFMQRWTTVGTSVDVK